MSAVVSGQILTFDGVTPALGDGVFVATGAVVIGDTTLGDGVSVWFNTVIRGDVCPIRIGARTNIQDLCMVHVTSGKHPAIIGEDVTVGHRAILHGCTIGDNCLIGMGAIILDGAVVEDDCLIGAGSVVTPGTRIPAGTLAIGSPARVKRDLTPADIESFRESARHYAELAAQYAGV